MARLAARQEVTATSPPNGRGPGGGRAAIHAPSIDRSSRATINDVTTEDAFLEIEIGVAAQAERVGHYVDFNPFRRRARRLGRDFPEFLAIARAMLDPASDPSLQARFDLLYARMRAKRGPRDRRRARNGSTPRGYPSIVEPLAVVTRAWSGPEPELLRDIMSARVGALLRGDQRALRITYDMLALVPSTPAERARFFSEAAEASLKDVTATLHFGLALADAQEPIRARAEFRRILSIVRRGTRLRPLVERLARSCPPARSRFDRGA